MIGRGLLYLSTLQQFIVARVAVAFERERVLTHALPVAHCHSTVFTPRVCVCVCVLRCSTWLHFATAATTLSLQQRQLIRRRCHRCFQGDAPDCIHLRRHKGNAQCACVCPSSLGIVRLQGAALRRKTTARRGSKTRAPECGCWLLSTSRQTMSNQKKANSRRVRNNLSTRTKGSTIQP